MTINVNNESMIEHPIEDTLHIELIKLQQENQQLINSLNTSNQELLKITDELNLIKTGKDPFSKGKELTIALINDDGEIQFLGNSYSDTTRYTPWISDLLIKENKELKEQKRLILKKINYLLLAIDDKRFIPSDNNLDNLRNTLTKILKFYNTEELTEEDFKYKHYLEKENSDMVKELQKNNIEIINLKEKLKQKEDIIKEAREELQRGITFCQNDSQGAYDICNMAINRDKKVLSILDKGCD